MSTYEVTDIHRRSEAEGPNWEKGILILYSSTGTCIVYIIKGAGVGASKVMEMEIGNISYCRPTSCSAVALMLMLGIIGKFHTILVQHPC